MARVLRKARYNDLRLNWFTPKEARELSRVPKETPALRLLKAERMERRARFEKIASRKLASGDWRRRDIQRKWVANLSRMYRKQGWNIQDGPVGKQEKVGPKGSPNPWAMYRGAESRTGGSGAKKHVSPWEVKQIRGGKTPLQKGLIFVQKQERAAKLSGTGVVNKSRVKVWVNQLEASIKESRGRRRAELVIQKNRLERLL